MVAPTNYLTQRSETIETIIIQLEFKTTLRTCAMRGVMKG
jgi:hypothetical protein